MPNDLPDWRLVFIISADGLNRGLVQKSMNNVTKVRLQAGSSSIAQLRTN